MSSNSSEWGKVGSSYKSLSQIPYSYSKIATPLLFPSSEITSRTSPITLLDVAGGPGTFISATHEYLRENSLVIPCQSSMTSTDFAEGMVQQAQSQLGELDMSTIGNPRVSCLVLDACDPHPVPNYSFSHLSCMFGIMFFPKRSEALRKLHEKLIPNVGRAVFSSWNSTSLMTVCEEYSALVDLSSVSSFAARSTALDICRFPEDFANELIEAGFRNVTINQYEEVFQVDEEALFNMNIRNPAIVEAFPAIAATQTKKTVEELRSIWLLYLDSPQGKARCFVDSATGKVMVRLEYRANIALSTA